MNKFLMVLASIIVILDFILKYFKNIKYSILIFPLFSINLLEILVGLLFVILIYRLIKLKKYSNEKKEIEKKMKLDNNLYYIEGEKNKYCPGCWNQKKRKTPLLIEESDSGNYYKCPCSDCNFEYFIDNPNFEQAKSFDRDDMEDYF